MCGFRSGSDFINDERSFQEHVRKAFRKTDPSQSSPYVCPLDYCRTEINHQYNVRRHFKDFHKELVPFLFPRTQRSAPTDSHPPNADTSPSPLEFDHSLPSVHLSANASANHDSPSTLDFDSNDFDIDYLPRPSLDDHPGDPIGEQCSGHLISQTEMPIYRDCWQSFVGTLEMTKIENLLRKARTETSSSESAISKIFLMASDHFSKTLEEKGILNEEARQVFTEFNKYASSFYYVNRDTIRPENEEVLKKFQLQPKIEGTKLPFYYVSIIHLLRKLASSEPFMKAVLLENRSK